MGVLRLQNDPLRAEPFGGQCGGSTAGPSKNQFATMVHFVEADVS